MTPVMLPANESAAIGQWVAARIPGCERGFENFVSMGIFDGPDLVAGLVFHNWSPEAGVIEISAAADTPRWLTKRVLWEMHRYIFETAGCQMAVMRVSEKNKRALRIIEGYGYEKHRIPRLRGRNEAECILTLTDDDWRASKFHKKVNHGQAKSA